jgi:hypothetical protein
LSSLKDEKSVNRARGLQRSEHYSTFGCVWLTIVGYFAVKMISRETEWVHILAFRDQLASRLGLKPQASRTKSLQD